MTQTESAEETYALGHSAEELERLTRQAQRFEALTRHLFQLAGVTTGMRVLDVGCGSGDVSFLVAGLVGPSGEVIGADIAPEAVNLATARAKAKNIGNVKFLQGDPAELRFDRPFDAVVGRLVLMYYPDPVDAVRKLKGHLDAGGLVVFQELDFANARSVPPAPTVERHQRWVNETFSATGARLQFGPELYSIFLNAGLPGPTMRMDALIGGGPEHPAYDLLVEVTKSLLPVMEKLKIATAAEVDLPTLGQRIRDEMVASNGVIISPGLIGAWSRKL